MSRSPLRLFHGTRVKRSHLLLLGAAIALAATIATSFRGIPHLNAAASPPARVFSPRLSIEQTFRPCTVLGVSSGRTVPREQCDTHEVPMVDLAALADSAGSSDPRSLQASALGVLTAPNSTDESLDLAIALLSRALMLSPPTVPLLVDLSGAHLARAEQTGNPHDLLEGLDYALQALAREPRNPAALFNSALALEAWGLDEQATLTWRDYLRVDSTSKWAGEARRRLRGIQHPPPPPPAPRPESSLEEVRTFVARDPQRARLIGWDSVLGQWGAAREAGKAEEAAGLLQLADRLGAALAWQGGDASLADAVGAIRAVADDPAATLTLARAHRRYAAAQLLYEEPDTRDDARDSLARVLAVRPRSPTLMQWANAYQAAAWVYRWDYPRAESTYHALLTGIDSVRHPALAARVQWMRGSSLGRWGHYIQARESHRSAARLFELAGETEYAAYAHAQYGEAAYYQRDTLAAYPAMHRALQALHKYRSSWWRHNTLFVLANSATTEGMPLAAEKFLDEDAGVARPVSASTATIEALTSLAVIHAATGRGREAAEDLDRAAALVARMADTKPRRDFDAAIGFQRTLVDTSSTAVAGLDSAVAYFTKTEDPYWLIPALLRRADLRLAHGQLAAATADLDDATQRIRDLSHNQAMTSLRVAMMEPARTRFDQVVMIHLGAGDTIEALRAVERGRVSFSPGTPATTPRRPAAPPGEVAVEYALIGDTLLTWTVRGNDVRLRRATLDRGDFRRRVGRVNTLLESWAPAASARRDLERLYDLLIQPVERELGPPGTPLVILADGEVAGVPFAVLRDGARGQYLLETRAHRFAATLADAGRPAPVAAAGRRTLLVANPAFDPHFNPSLDRLQGARAEVDALGRLYPDSMLLADAGATRQALVERAPRAGIIHYAGHALFDDARPERSALVLADPDTTGHLTTDAVNGLRLGGVRLVVLSACRTLRSRDGRSGGLSGLSGALLAAGAGGVVGSLWQVDDGRTQPFMVAFHRAYRERNGNAAAALRDAQLRMLRSDSSFATWAGFRYIGR